MAELKESTKTFGVKVPETLYAEANRLKDEFGTGEDFLNQLIIAYKSEKVKEIIPLVATDITVLQTLTKKIFEIYLNLSYSIETISQSKDEEMTDKLEKKDLIISSLQDNINGLNIANEKFLLAFNNEKEDKDGLEKQVNQLIETINSKNDTIESNKGLIEEYKSKNDTLTGLLSKYEGYPKEIENLNTVLAEKNSIISTALSESKDKDREINDLEIKLDSLLIKNEVDLKNITLQGEYLKDKAILEADKEHQSIINKLNEENNNKVKSLLNENEKYNEKISKLMEENQLKSNENNALDMKVKEQIIEIENLKNISKSKK